MFDPVTLVLEGEDPDFLKYHINEARSLFQPRNGFEKSIVDHIGILQYRQRRIAVFERGLMKFQRILTPSYLINNWPGIDEAGRHTLAATRMRTKIRDMLGLETSLARLLHQALKTLELIRKITNPCKPAQPRNNSDATPAGTRVNSGPEKL